MRAIKAWLLSAAVSVTSCGSPTEPLSGVSAVVVPASVSRIVDPLSGQVGVSLRFAITNPTTGPIYYVHCSASLERQASESRWELVASKICFTYASSDPLDGTQEIPAGTSGEVGAFLSGIRANGLPSPIPEGIYRVRFSVLSRNPVVYRGAYGSQYKSTQLATSEFAIASPN